jgi:hypothetical protein
MKPSFGTLSLAKIRPVQKSWGGRFCSKRGVEVVMVRFIVLCTMLYSFKAFAELPFETIFEGREQFERLVADGERYEALPFNDRVAALSFALIGTPYCGESLEIDDRIEAPSVNLSGFDCWTYFQITLAMTRMLDERRDQWIPQTLLKYVELDRYRGGKCSGSYLSRLHYFEDWLADNEQRGLIKDITCELGDAVSSRHAASEMTYAWRRYRYMRNSPDVFAGIAEMETRIRATPIYYIPTAQVPAIESRLQNGDIICICVHESSAIATAHVGFAYRTNDGILHFLHCSSSKRHKQVVLDGRLSDYLDNFYNPAGIMVGRPLK